MTDQELSMAIEYREVTSRPIKLSWWRRWMALAAFALLAGGLVATSQPAAAQTVSYDLKTTSVMRIKLPVSQAICRTCIVRMSHARKAASTCSPTSIRR